MGVHDSVAEEAMADRNARGNRGAFCRTQPPAAAARAVAMALEEYVKVVDDPHSRKQLARAVAKHFVKWWGAHGSNNDMGWAGGL